VESSFVGSSVKMATDKIRADSGFTRSCPRPKSCARARARHPPRPATYATPARSLHLGATGGRHCSCTSQYVSNCHSICYSCRQIWNWNMKTTTKKHKICWEASRTSEIVNLPLNLRRGRRRRPAGRRRRPTRRGRRRGQIKEVGGRRRGM
jgi:hypothetical protein